MIASLYDSIGQNLSYLSHFTTNNFSYFHPKTIVLFALCLNRIKLARKIGYDLIILPDDHLDKGKCIDNQSKSKALPSKKCMSIPRGAGPQVAHSIWSHFFLPGILSPSRSLLYINLSCSWYIQYASPPRLLPLFCLDLVIIFCWLILCLGVILNPDLPLVLLYHLIFSSTSVPACLVPSICLETFFYLECFCSLTVPLTWSALLTGPIPILVLSSCQQDSSST